MLRQSAYGTEGTLLTGAGEPLRVLHVVASNQRRGAEVFAADLLRALSSVDHSLVHLRAAAAPTVVFPCPTRCLGMRGVLGVVPAIRALRKAVVDSGCHVVQAHGGEALRIAVLAGVGRRIPIVYRRIGMAARSMRGGWRRRWHQWLMRRAAVVICVSDAVRAESLERFNLDPARTITVPNGIDPARVITDGSIEGDPLSGLGVRVDGCTILSLGALSWEKDPLGMLDATADLLRDDSRNRHVFVGDGPLRPALNAKVAALRLDERVTVAGAREDVRPALAAADVVLFASRSDGMEGMPATVIEAGLAGRPVVAAAVAGVGEVVVDGETGILVPPGDVSQLQAAVRDLLDDPVRRRSLGEAAARRCRERFTIEVVAQRYLEVWHRIAASTRA